MGIGLETRTEETGGEVGINTNRHGAHSRSR